MKTIQKIKTHKMHAESCCWWGCQAELYVCVIKTSSWFVVEKLAAIKEKRIFFIHVFDYAAI